MEEEGWAVMVVMEVAGGFAEFPRAAGGRGQH